METLKELVAKMTKCHEESREILGKIDSAENDESRTTLRTQYDAKTKEFEGLKGKVAEAKAVYQREKDLAEAEALSQVDDSGVSFTVQGKTRPHIQVGSPESDARAKKGFFMTYMQSGAKALEGRAFDAILSKDPRALKEAEDPVSMPRDMVFNIMAQAPFGAKIVINNAQQRVQLMRWEEMGGKVILSTDATGGSTDSGAANLLAPDFRPSLLQMPISAPTIYDYCRFIPAVNGTAEWPMLDQAQGNYGGVAFTWKSTEGADKGETEPVFKDFTVSTSELSGWTEMSLTALRRSAIDLEATLTQLFRDAVRYEWSYRVLRGTGTNQPLGILLDPNVNLVTRATGNQVVWADLVNLEYAVKQALRVNGRFTIDDSVEKYLKTQVDSNKKPVFTPDIMSQIRTLLAGYGYNAHEYGPTLGNEGDTVFGNFQHYAWAMEEDIAIARSEHAEFKKGRVVFRLICFVGGKPIFPSAFAILDNSAS